MQSYNTENIKIHLVIRILDKIFNLSRAFVSF